MGSYLGTDSPCSFLQPIIGYSGQQAILAPGSPGPVRGVSKHHLNLVARRKIRQIPSLEFSAKADPPFGTLPVSRTTRTADHVAPFGGDFWVASNWEGGKPRAA